MAFAFFNKDKNNNNKSEMAFIDHLEALRWHVVRSLLAVVILAIAVYINIDWIFDYRYVFNFYFINYSPYYFFYLPFMP